MEYILSNRQEGCVFCDAFAADPSEDDKTMIVHRGQHNAVIMNLYPYNNGHLMVVPYAHQTTMEGLPPEALLEAMNLMNQALGILRETMNAEGFNVGINLGKSAGAGIDQHVHLHVVPRWTGDTNFITTVGNVRCIPESMQDSYHKIREAWEKATQDTTAGERQLPKGDELKT
jgi:ATP adenylyltransferase